MHLHFQIPSSTRTLCFLRQLFSGLNISGEIAWRCAAALVEAVDNAIIHAHKRDENRLIDIKIIIGNKKISIAVKDSGPGFRFEEIILPGPYQTHGRGLYIIKGLMGRVGYKNNTMRMEIGV